MSHFDHHVGLFISKRQRFYRLIVLFVLLFTVPQAYALHILIIDVLKANDFTKLRLLNDWHLFA